VAGFQLRHDEMYTRILDARTTSLFGLSLLLLLLQPEAGVD
jgi:hypothetical protein